MNTLNLSVAAHHRFGDIDKTYSDLINPTLKRLGTETSIETISWEELWQYAQAKTISVHDRHISEIGTTWIGSLVDADSVRPLSDALLRKIDTDSPFSDAAKRCMRTVSPTANLFVPLLQDVRLIYFWRDHLEAAHINADNAFSTIENMHSTLEKLRAAGLPGWGAPTFKSINTVYHIASWIWAKGKDYLSATTNRTELGDPDVIDAIMAYFELAQYMPRPFDDYLELVKDFRNKEVSVIMDGPSLWFDIYKDRDNPDGLKTVGLANPPGPPFLGGSALVIWKQTPEKMTEAAEATIAALVTNDAQRIQHDVRGLLPVNRATLSHESFATDENYQTLITALDEGRYLPTGPLWGHLETSLARIFALVWQRLKQDGFRMDPNLLSRHLTPLATRFDKMSEMF